MKSNVMKFWPMLLFIIVQTGTGMFWAGTISTQMQTVNNSLQILNVRVESHAQLVRDTREQIAIINTNQQMLLRRLDAE